MRPVILRAWIAFLLGFVLVVVPVFAADEKPSKEPPPKAPDWSNYVFVADVVGGVVKSSDKGITLRVTWFEAEIKGGNKNNNRNNRPGLGQNNRNFRNPYAPNMNRPNQPKAQFKEQHHDYDLEYVSESLVRFKSLPPKYDETRKKLQYTQKELEELRLPQGVTGYKASTSDLTPGTIVEVILIRDKSIPAAKADEDDLRIKYVIILGQDPNPPKEDNRNKKGAKKDAKKDKD